MSGAAIAFNGDEVPSYQTPIDSVIDEELEQEEFVITRTHSISPYFIKTETAYQLLLTSGYFNGPEYEQKGLTDFILRYKSKGSRSTFLHLAVSARHDAAVEWLVSKGANIYEKDIDGWSPLDIAQKTANDGAFKRLSDAAIAATGPEAGASVSSPARVARA